MKNSKIFALETDSNCEKIRSMGFGRNITTNIFFIGYDSVNGRCSPSFFTIDSPYIVLFKIFLDLATTIAMQK